MIVAKPSLLGRAFWITFTVANIKWRFKSVHISLPDAPEENKAVLLLGNHMSFWDPFWINYISRTSLGKEYYVMMLEDELKSRILLRQGGAFSINPGSRSILQTIDYTNELLANSSNLVLVYPQGKIFSSYQSNIVFQSGIEHIIRRSTSPFQLYFYAAFVDYLADMKPSVYLYFKKIIAFDGLDYKDLERLYQEHYNRSLEIQSGLEK